MRIGRLSITASRWPWQGYGWRGTSKKVVAPLAAGARFGGGWKWKLGIAIGGRSVLVDLLFGSIRFEMKSRAEIMVENVRSLYKERFEKPMPLLADGALRRAIEATLKKDKKAYHAPAAELLDNFLRSHKPMNEYQADWDRFVGRKSSPF